jgi:hypothetical protein
MTSWQKQIHPIRNRLFFASATILNTKKIDLFMNGFKTQRPYLYVLCLLCTVFQLHGVYSQQTPVLQDPPQQLIEKLISSKVLHDTAFPKSKARLNMTAMALAGSGPAGPLGAAESTLPPVVMPSPNSAILTRLISDNVDLYTGRLNVDIPIYTLKSRDLEVPISLQGNVNAHKVNECAGSTGMGWFLNAGGSITRVMKNLPDEFTGTICPNFNFPGVGYTKLKQSENVDINLFEGGSYDLNKKQEIIGRGNWNASKNENPGKGYDLQPDEFYFNFGKQTGKFVFDQDGNIHTVSKSNLTITPFYEVREGNNRLAGFQVITEDGYRYQFGGYNLNAVEETKLSTQSKFIRYYYEAVSINNQLVMDGNRYLYYSTPRVATMVQPSATPALDNFDRNVENIDLFNYSSTWYLVSITSPTFDQVTFNYENRGSLVYMSDRSFSASMPNLDQNQYMVSPLSGFYYLSAVEPIQAASWFPRHFPSPFIFSVTNSTTTLRSRRLVSIVGAGNNRMSFVYNTAREDLPGDQRLDKIVVTNSINTVLKEFKLDYEVRYSGEEVENFAFYYNMVKFYYNGGAYSGYDYTQPNEEDRTFDIPDYFRKRMFLKSIQETGSGISLPPYKFEYNSMALPFRSSSHQDYFGFHTINNENHPLTDLRYTIYINGQPRNVPKAANLFSLRVTNGTSQMGNYEGNKQPIVEQMQAGVLTKITYPTGGYKTFEFEFNGIRSRAWNGLRVRTIKEYASPTTTPIVKEYSYGTFYPTDEVVTKHEMMENKAGNYYDDRVFWTSGRANPENLTRGVAGGYDFAEIKQPGNGRYRIEFTNPSMADLSDTKNMVKIVSGLINPTVQDLATGIAPFPTSTNFDWKRGLPLEEYTYTENGKLQKRTSYQYDFTTLNAQDKKIEGMAVTKVRLNFQTGSWNWHLYGKYAHYSNWYALASRTDKVYAADGVNYVETKEEYTQTKPVIGNQEFMFPKLIKAIKPGKNEQLVTVFKYPWNYALGLPYDDFESGIDFLAKTNVLNGIIEKYQYLQNSDGSNPRVVGGTMNQYYADRPWLKQTYSLKVASPLNYTTYFGTAIAGGNFSYDANYKPDAGFKYGPLGNIVEQSDGANIKQSYIWDDNQMYPIAKVVNAAQSECAYASFEEGAVSGNWIITGLHLTDLAITGKRGFELRSDGTLKRTGLDPAKTYVISWWCNGNSDLVINGNSTYNGVPTHGDWSFNETTISGVSQVVVSGGFGYIDEVRLYPKSAQMTSYINEPMIGVTTQIDVNNRILQYEYDGLQRLKLIKDENGNVLKTFDYNYQNDNSAPMWASTNDKRCAPCPRDNNYHTTFQEVRQIDVNPNSPTYNTERWYNLGITGACTIEPDWQNISGPVCLLNNNGFNTGIQRIVQQNMNPCHSEYLKKRDIDITNYTLCPSNEPNYQPLDEYRCQPCPANAAYTSKVQERKWKDVNPNSATNGNIDWRATGAPCANQPSWQNTATAPRCMINAMNLPNGYQEREQRDMNPCSDTYNQIVWVQDAATSSCRKVYVFIDMDDFKSTWPDINGASNDVWVRFYYDPNRTQPATVSNAKITIVENHMSGCGDYTVEKVFNNVSGQSIKLYEDVLSEYELPDCYVYVNFASKDY